MRPLAIAAGVLALLFALAAGVLRDARGELLESEELNYEIETPEGWSRQPADETWAAYGIVAGSARRLDTLEGGETANGEGGELYLAVTDAPEGRTLDDLAADAEVRGFLMSRFGAESAQWPEVNVVSDRREEGLEVRVLTADGEALNLAGRRGAVRAVLLLARAKGRLYKLRMYAWHTPHDGEGLKRDLDSIEMAFEIPDLGEETPRETPGARPPDGEETAPRGDAGVEKPLGDELVGWKLVKPVGIRTKDDYDRETYRDVVAWFEDSDPGGSYQVVLTVVPRGRRDESNRTLRDPDLEAWGLDGWWKEFDADHAAGPVHTYAWPRRSKTFLTLPDWEKERVVWEEPGARPREPGTIDARALLKKGVAEKVRNERLGRERTNGAYRGALSGNRSGQGREWAMRYVWGTPRLTCYLLVTIAREGRTKWTGPIDALLASIEMTGRP